MFKNRSAVLGYVVLIVMLTAGTAQSLSGSNTVYSDDIVDSQIYNRDIHDGAVNGAKIADNSLTGADINESTLAMPKILTARINIDGTVYKGNVTTSHTFTGIYDVYFPRNVDTCTAVASPATQYTPSSMAQTGTVGNDVTVTIRDMNGIANRPFSLIVACP